jgi:hypothetical protein
MLAVGKRYAGIGDALAKDETSSNVIIPGQISWANG